MGKLNCWQCGASIDDQPLPLSRHAACSACHYELHTCRQCVHHRPDTHSLCHEERAEVPSNKEVANFCDFFAPAALTAQGAASGPDDKAAAARAKLDDLFS